MPTSSVEYLPIMGGFILMVFLLSSLVIASFNYSLTQEEPLALKIFEWICRMMDAVLYVFCFDWVSDILQPPSGVDVQSNVLVDFVNGTDHLSGIVFEYIRGIQSEFTVLKNGIELIYKYIVSYQIINVLVSILIIFLLYRITLAMNIQASVKSKHLIDIKSRLEELFCLSNEQKAMVEELKESSNEQKANTERLMDLMATLRSEMDGMRINNRQPVYTSPPVTTTQKKSQPKQSASIGEKMLNAGLRSNTVRSSSRSRKKSVFDDDVSSLEVTEKNN